jgi:hypothetical protein
LAKKDLTTTTTTTTTRNWDFVRDQHGVGDAEARILRDYAMKTGRTETEVLQALVRSLVPNSTASLTNEEGEVRELTEEDFKGMRPLAETDPGMIEAVNNGGRS